ncbi:FAD-binding and (Fe-S)-binding domain-containing protein [Francisella adeliensis]|nr:FAD-binding and (Fe-S)-binding domain-containing protein [Francisella adeliensis]
MTTFFMLKNFKSNISKYINSSQIIENELLRYAYSTDASPYRMVPKLVLIVRTDEEVKQLLKLANSEQIKLTFRTAGTSLSGQAVTDEVLVILAADSWLNYEVSTDGTLIKLQPSIIGAQANKYLKIHKKKIGPDPGSINSAKIGGIIANNSSGMCCGTARNSYATIDSLKVIFADGEVLDTKDENSVKSFLNSKNDFITELVTIRNTIKQDKELEGFIRKKFAIKNTSGYSLNAFLDFEDPIKIIERLIVGSEGTLGFVSEVTLNTVPDYESRALNLIYGKLDDLVALTTKLEQSNVSSVELLDYQSLKSVESQTDLKSFLIPLVDQNTAAIMVELAEENQQKLQQKLKTVESIIDGAEITHQVGFKTDEVQMQTLWKTRNGVLPTIAGARPDGTTVLIEDIAVNILDLPALIVDLKKMFVKYSYNNAAIFGHVLAGNIHFVLTPNFNNKDELINYDNFMKELTDVVAGKYNGSLKAEHGSGRNISPFAIVEWGEKCWDIMWQIKSLFDPKHILNPDVKITKDKNLHTKNLKELNNVDEQIDKCMECGFCEPVCPSRSLSLTPRQRNTVARKINTLKGAEKEKWQQDFEYYGIKTCATTSLCKTRCPVDIDTGSFILSQKAEANKSVNHAKEISAAKLKVQMGNVAAKVVGKENLQNITKAVHSKFKAIPIYLDTMPKAQSDIFANTNPSISNKSKVKKALLLPACPNRIFSSANDSMKYPSQLILEKLGYDVEYPTDVNSKCCGQMYNSMRNVTQEKVIEKDLQEIDYTQYDVAVLDNSSCSNFAKHNGVEIVDINSLILENLDTLNIRQKYKSIALHIDCSTRKQNIDQKYIDALNKCANEVVTPEMIYCCGFAGDKGFSVPELNASSLSGLQSQIKDCDIGVSFNRSCQIGLSHHGKLKYVSFVDLLLDCVED